MTENYENWVFLTTGPEYDDGELVLRSDLPDDAFPTAIVARQPVNMIDPDDTSGATHGFDVVAIER